MNIENATSAAPTRSYIEERGFHLRGMVGAVLIGGVTIAAACSTPLTAIPSAARTFLAALGWASFLAGAGVRLWSTLYIGGRKVGGRRENVLTVDGPYSIVRNPLYVGSLLIGLSTALLLQSATVLAAVIAAAVHYAWKTVPAEERFLRGLCGAATFDDYCRRTPRFIPNPRLYRSPAEVTVYVKAMRNEARRLLRLLPLPMLLTLLNELRHSTVWPAWFTLP